VVLVDVDVLDDVDVTSFGTVVAGNVGSGLAGCWGAAVVVVVGRVVVVVLGRVVATGRVVGGTVGPPVMPPDETTVNVASSVRIPSPVSHVAVTV
jgi:hypothetical protein